MAAAAKSEPTSRWSQFTTDVQQRWNTFAEEHPLAAGAVVLTGIGTLGVVIAAVGPTLSAPRLEGEIPSDVFSSGRVMAQVTEHDYHFPIAYYEGQTVRDDSSFFDRYKRALGNLFSSSDELIPVPFSRAYASRVDTRSFSLPKLNSTDPGKFPKVDQIVLPPLQPGSSYSHYLEPTLVTHPKHTAQYLTTVPSGLTVDQRALLLSGTLADEMKVSPLLIFSALELGQDTPLVTTMFVHLPIEGVTAERDFIRLDIEQGRECRKVPMLPEFFGGDFDELQFEPHPNYPYPDGWIDLDPDLPFTVRNYPPDGITEGTLRFGYFVRAYNQGQFVGEIEMSPRVKSAQNAQPTLNVAYWTWRPTKGSYIKTYKDYPTSWTATHSREIVDVTCTSRPRREKDDNSWVRIHTCGTRALLEGKPPRKPSDIVITCTAYDNAGSGTPVDVWTYPEKHDAVRRFKEFGEIVGYIIAAGAGLTALRHGPGFCSDMCKRRYTASHTTERTPLREQ